MRLYLYIILVFLFLFYSCEIISKSNDEMRIAMYDIEGMRAKLLSNFELVRKNARMNEGYEYRFKNMSDTSETVSIRIGIFQSQSEALDLAIERMNWFSAVPHEDTLKVLGIGDRCWSMPMPGQTYLFSRSNVFINVNSSSIPNSQLLELTRSIDNDIINNADYIKIDNSISLPKIEKISVSKSELNEGESATITVSAFDPNNNNLECMCLPGIPQNGNIFTLTATRSYISEPFIGQHTYEFQVINEMNVLSKVKEITININ